MDCVSDAANVAEREPHKDIFFIHVGVETREKV